MIKELLHTGIGAGLLLKEKVEEEMKKLEDEGKIKSTDTKSFFESIENKGKEEEAKNKEELKSLLKDIIDDLGLATKDDLDSFSTLVEQKITLKTQSIWFPKAQIERGRDKAYSDEG